MKEEYIEAWMATCSTSMTSKLDSSAFGTFPMDDSETHSLQPTTGGVSHSISSGTEAHHVHSGSTERGKVTALHKITLPRGTVKLQADSIVAPDSPYSHLFWTEVSGRTPWITVKDAQDVDRAISWYRHKPPGEVSNLFTWEGSDNYYIREAIAIIAHSCFKEYIGKQPAFLGNSRYLHEDVEGTIKGFLGCILLAGNRLGYAEAAISLFFSLIRGTSWTLPKELYEGVMWDLHDWHDVATLEFIDKMNIKIFCGQPARKKWLIDMDYFSKLPVTIGEEAKLAGILAREADETFFSSIFAKLAGEGFVKSIDNAAETEQMCFVACSEMLWMNHKLGSSEFSLVD